MQPEFLNRLAPEVRALVEAVEHDSGVEVLVHIDATRGGRGPEGKGILACNIEAREVRLLTPTPDYFPDGAVVHELLHVRRLLVDGVPRISDREDFGGWHFGLGSALADIDNALEHLVIVPEELALRPERSGHWEGVMATLWETKLPAIANANDQRRRALLYWVFMRHVLPDSNVMPTAAKTIERMGLAAKADQLFNALIPSLGSKERTVQSCFEQLSMPLETATLEYLDSRTGRTCEVPLGSPAPRSE